jgi:hypothetical protein
MIEARELRIGNFIHYVQANGNLVDWFVCASDISAIETDNEGYKPIEINHELFLKFGFVKEKNGWYALKRGSKKNGNLKIFRIALFYSGYNTKGGCMGGYNGVKYVHQLQNLYFSLTGQELTIK